MPSNPQIPRVGSMFYPPKRNGNMPAVQVRPRCILGEMTLMRLGLIMIPNQLGQTRDVGNYAPTRGAFSICMEMCGSGPRIGTVPILPATL